MTFNAEDTLILTSGRSSATRGCPSDDLSFYDSSHDADWTLVIPDPILLQRSALSFSPRDREHAERGVGDRSTIVSLGSCTKLSTTEIY